MKPNGAKVILPRSEPDHFWKLVQQHCAHEDQRKWKYLAMLALRENAGWTLEQIGKVFGHPKGHISRCLRNIKQEMRNRFRMSPERLTMSEQDAAEPSEETQLRGKTGRSKSDSRLDDRCHPHPKAKPNS